MTEQFPSKMYWPLFILWCISIILVVEFTSLNKSSNDFLAGTCYGGDYIQNVTIAEHKGSQQLNFQTFMTTKNDSIFTASVWYPSNTSFVDEDLTDLIDNLQNEISFPCYIARDSAPVKYALLEYSQRHDYNIILLFFITMMTCLPPMTLILWLCRRRSERYQPLA